MKKLNRIIGLFVISIACVVKAQDSFTSINLSGLSDNGVLALNGTNMMSLKSWSDDQLAALVGALETVPTVPMSSLPVNRWGNLIGGTFWSLQTPGIPFPSDTPGVDVWPMADGSFLLDDLSFDYDALSASPMLRMGTMSAEDAPDIPGGSGGGGNPQTIILTVSTRICCGCKSPIFPMERCSQICTTPRIRYMPSGQPRI